MAHEALLHAWSIRAGIRTVFTDHSMFGFAGASAVLMNKLLLRYSLANVDRLICVSHTSKENTVLRAGVAPQCVFVIPNAIDSALFLPDPTLFRVPKAHNCGGAQPTRLPEGADLLVEVIPDICERHPTVQFLIDGDGPKRVDIEEMRERCRLHERVKMSVMRLSKAKSFSTHRSPRHFAWPLLKRRVAVFMWCLLALEEFPKFCRRNSSLWSTQIRKQLQLVFWMPIRRRENGELPCPVKKHRQMAEMYNWSDIAQRTERVYGNSLKEPEGSIDHKLRNQLNAGFWFGLIWAWVTAVNILFASVLDWVDPRDGIETVDNKAKTNN